MKQLFIILAVILTFSSISGTSSDTVHINFNKTSYVKKIPKNYEESVAMIKTMENLFNNFDSVYSSLDSTYNVIKNKADTLESKVTTYTGTITTLSKNVDSLSRLINIKSETIQQYAKLYSDSLQVLIELLDKKNDVVKFGLGLGANTDFSSLQDIYVTPILTYKNMFTSLNLGAYRADKEYLKKLGLNCGFFLK